MHWQNLGRDRSALNTLLRQNGKFNLVRNLHNQKNYWRISPIENRLSNHGVRWYISRQCSSVEFLLIIALMTSSVEAKRSHKENKNGKKWKIPINYRIESRRTLNRPIVFNFLFKICVFLYCQRNENVWIFFFTSLNI